MVSWLHDPTFFAVSKASLAQPKSSVEGSSFLSASATEESTASAKGDVRAMLIVGITGRKTVSVDHPGCGVCAAELCPSWSRMGIFIGSIVSLGGVNRKKR
jgi:hypothetical protein